MLRTLRHTYCPTLERLYPRGKFYEEVFTREYAGGIKGRSPREIARSLDSLSYWYRNGLASLKYRCVDGQKDDEVYSYAYRPNGRQSKWQTHVRLFEHSEGTAVYCHYEYNPRVKPIAHYNGRNWDAQKGKAVAREQLPIDETIPMEHEHNGC